MVRAAIRIFCLLMCAFAVIVGPGADRKIQAGPGLRRALSRVSHFASSLVTRIRLRLLGFHNFLTIMTFIA